MLNFKNKKFFAVIVASIFLFTPVTYAENVPAEKSAEQRDEEDFTTYAPVVEEPFSENVKSPEPEEVKPVEPEKVEVEKVPENEVGNTEVGSSKKIEKLFEPQQENISEPEEGDGLEFLIHNEDGVMAFAIIAAHEKYNLRPIIARDKIRGVSTVSQISSTYNDIAMVNGGYFSWTGNLIGLTKINGVIVSNDYFNRSAVGIADDGTVIFGRVRYEGKIIYRGAEIPVNVNSERGADSAVVYNEFFGASTGTNNFGTEIEIQNGVITNIFNGKGNNFILKGAKIISAHGKAAEIFSDAQIGDEINFVEEIISDDGDFNSVPNILGAGPRLVANGQIFVTADAEEFPADIKVGRAPRSAVGVTKWGDYILAVVDGRQAQSRGCTLQEWAEILLNKFGAVDAINLDGGGSSALVVKDKLVNSPSDGAERSVGSVLAILPK